LHTKNNQTGAGEISGTIFQTIKIKTMNQITSSPTTIIPANKIKTAKITSLKYEPEINVVAYYSKEFKKHWRINTNDSDAFMKLRMLINDLLDDGFKVEWK
jgi:hypothetical protein